MAENVGIMIMEYNWDSQHLGSNHQFEIVAKLVNMDDIYFIYTQQICYFIYIYNIPKQSTF